MQKYFKIFKIALSNQLEYRVNFVSSFLFSLIPFGVNSLLCLAFAKKNGDMIFDESGILSYYFVTLIVSNITSTASVFKVSDDIRLGELSKYIIKPYHYALYQLMVDMPQRIIFITMNAVPVLCLYAALRNYMNFSITMERVFVMMILLIIGYLINFFIDFSVALYSFYFSKVSSLYTSIKVIQNIFSGVVFPLIMLPDKAMSFLESLPFIYTSYVPAMFLIKNIPFRIAFQHMMTALIWLLILVVSSIALWRRGIKRYCAFGG